MHLNDSTLITHGLRLDKLLYLNSNLLRGKQNLADFEVVWSGLQSKIEQKRMKDEARAIEHKKREEAKAEQAIRTAEVCFIFTKTHFVIHRI